MVTVLLVLEWELGSRHLLVTECVCKTYSVEHQVFICNTFTKHTQWKKLTKSVIKSIQCEQRYVKE